MIAWTSLFVVLALAPVAIASSATNSTLKFNWSRPSCAIPIPEDLCSLSIEPDRWPEWAGNVTHRNDFTYTLLDNLKERTGQPPRVRVGGGTSNRVTYETNMTRDPGFLSVYPAVPSTITSTKQLFPEAESVFAGPDYWLCSCNLPNGTAFTWGVNFHAGSDEAVAQAHQIEKAFSNSKCDGIKLDNIAFGNEEDTIQKTVWDYQDSQNEYFSAVTKAIGNEGRKYRIGDFAKYWNSEELIATGIMQSSMGRHVNAIAEHHYQSRSLSLTAKANIRTELARYAQSARAAQQAGIDFVLGETNTYSGHGEPGVSNSAAAALWLVDYSLQAASIGISGLYLHQGIGYNYSAFVPVDHIGINITDYDQVAKRHVVPLYYGYLAVADAIGKSGRSYVNEVWTDNDNLAAYQIWEGTSLKRIMLINSVPWTTISAVERPFIAVNLPGLVGHSSVYKSLEIPSLTALSGITWGGQNWDTSDGSPTGKETFLKLGLSGTIMVNASSAVLIYL